MWLSANFCQIFIQSEWWPCDIYAMLFSTCLRAKNNSSFFKEMVVKRFVSHAEGFGLYSLGQCSEAIEGF